nr:NEAT domain-containing protein [Paenibacillus hamazuiensis]
MKSNIRQSVALCLSLALFLSSLLTALHINSGTADAAAAIPDNVYPVSYRYVKDGTGYDSAANLYLSVPGSGKLIVQNGKIKFEHEIAPQYYGYFQYLAYRNPGAAKAVINAAANTAAGTEGYTPFPVRTADNGSGNLIATINIEDITKKQDVLMHVVIKNAPEFGTGFEYDYWYNVQLEIDTSGLPSGGNDGGGTGGEPEQPVTIVQLQSLVSVSKSVYESTYEGNGLGDVPAGSKLTFYTKIVQAENFIASGNTSSAAIKAAYNELMAAYETFTASRYSADKRVLHSLIAVVTEFRDGIKEAGYAEGNPGGTLVPVSPGEFIVGPKNTITSAIEKARKVADNPKATQAEVDDAVRILTGQYNSAKDSYYIISSDSVKVIALDSLNPTTVPSAHSSLIAGTASFIGTKGADTGTKANITFNTSSNITDVKAPNVSSTGGYTAVESAVPAFKKGTDTNKQMFQVTVRRSNVNENTKWLGLTYLRYKVNGADQVTYLSFNADQLDALSQAAAAAQKLLDAAAVIPGAEAAYEAAKNALQAKIAAAKETAANLAATRPQIYEAGTALDQALSAFKATVTVSYPLYYSTVHATNDAFSSADSYFVKPAVITTDNDVTYASLTLKSSSLIKEFKVKTGGQYVDASVVSEDTAANTRVVQFAVDSLSSLLDAKVRIVVPAQSYDQTYDIRLNFNNVDNGALAQAIAEATAAYRSAVVGTEPGQYPQAAKTALQTAINIAGAEASRLTGTAAQSAAALAALQQALNTFKASVIVANPNPNPGTGTGEIPDGEYPIGFTIYKENTNEPSVMYDYVDKTSGKLSVRGGKKYISFTLKQDTEILSFKTKLNASSPLTETAVVARNSAANERTVEFEVEDVTNKVDGWVKIYWVLPAPIGIYDHEYNVQIGFSDLPVIPGPVNKAALNALIADAQAKHNAAVEGTAAGQYPAGSKEALSAAISAAQAVAANTSAAQEQVDQALAALQTAVNAFASSVITAPGTVQLPDGEYKLEFMIYKKGTADQSVMYDYVDQTSGKLKVEGGKRYVSFTLKQDAEIKSFKTKLNADSELTETTVVSRDSAANTRTVQFEAEDLNKKIDGWVKIYWELPAPIGIYDHEYDVEIGFGGITVADLSKPVNDGQYSFTFAAAPDDPAAAPIGSLVESGGSLKVQNGKKLATFKLKNGVTASKIVQLNADGTVNKEIVPQYSAKQQPGLVRVLADERAGTNLQFEADDLTATYAITLSSGGTETSYKLLFLSVSPVGTVTPTNPGNPSNPGNGSGGTGGGSTGGGGTGGGSTGGGSTGGTGGGSTGSSNLAEGKYTVNYTILKYETDQKSVMQDYVITPGILSVEGGKQYFSMTLKQSKEITSFKTEVNGSLTETEVIERNQDKNTRVVRFEVKDLSAKLKGWVKIDWAEMNYFHSYDIEISFDKASAKKVSSDTNLGGGSGAVVATLKNGEYDLNFKVLQHRNNLESRYNDVFEHPAKLIVKDGKRNVSLTINDHKQVDDFKVESEKEIENAAASGLTVTTEKVLNSATEVSKDETANKRVVSFEAKDLTVPVHVQLDIVVPPTEAELEQHKKDVEAAEASNDGYIPQLQKKIEKVDVDFVFDIDALGKKVQDEEAAGSESAAENPAATETGTPTSLSDIENHWAKAAIERAVALGIVDGYEDGSFRPDGEVSRAEFTAMIGRALKLEGKQAELAYADIGSIPAWAKPYLEQAVGAGIVNSYEDNTFRAERQITRSEIAVMVVRALGLPVDHNESLSFADAGQIPQWAYAQVAAAAKKGIINGRDNNVFAPNDRATRAEAVTLIMALLNGGK